MNIPLVCVKDTHGALAYDILKHDIEDQSIKAEDKEGELYITYKNINYLSIPGVDPRELTYKFYLTYNGTNGRNSLYTTLLMEKESILDISSPPIFIYSPEGFSKKYVETPEELENLDITYYTNEANILQFKPVVSHCDGSTTLTVMSHNYPHSIKYPPNISNQRINYDGWYTATYAVFKNLVKDDYVTKGALYSNAGIVGKAKDFGEVFIEDGIAYFTEDEEALEEITYEEFILAANNLTGIESNSSGHIVNSQILVTKDINTNIIESLTNINSSYTDDCDTLCEIADWQKLQQKRIASCILFKEGAYKKAQVIMESARKSCSINGKC
ncbi:MAG: hypothetical protein KAH32_04650 [Chlamydiia bacterium]|nr:hypothetical protein [Chlamydiia bacterium]